MRNAVLVISNINVDLIYEVERMPMEHEKFMAARCVVAGGGSGANTAHWLSRLGIQVYISGFVGKDIFGDFALGELTAAGVDVSGCIRLEDRTTNIVGIFSNGHNKSMVLAGLKYQPDAIDGLVKTTRDLDWSRIRHIHFATRDEILIERVMAATEDNAVSTSLELDGMYDAGLVRKADIVFSNMDELARATDTADPVSFLASAHSGDKTAFFVTEGASGARIISHGRVSHVPTVALEPVDRTGGGDAFDAGVLAAFMRGESLGTGAAKGLALASFVIQNWGARPSADAALIQRLIAACP